ncbi:phytanoyl-CoA dioxygenase family protein [Paenibacillus sp. MBLB4367]|uniref:phytanoyl-CoA dioxygenase family protein n=1 Tax=Paenibacillus sp. MBLB4367 TaxID=3384767 RepID=UPI003907F248
MKLTEKQVKQFHEEGYLVVENALNEADLAPVIAGIERFIDRRANELKEAGKIAELHEGESFEKRYTSLFMQSKEIGLGLDIMHSRIPELFDFLRNPNLLDVAGSLLGSDIMCNPIQHLRAKVPNRAFGTETPEFFLNVPWHQDAGVTLEEADETDMFTFWLPLVDAIAETGCMEVMPGVFKDGYLPHTPTDGFTIVPEHLPAGPVKLAPCPKGGIVIMNKYTPHRGTSNLSDIIRWSIDLRYHRTGQPSGRPYHPSFVARSESAPDSVLSDFNEWCRQWDEGLRLAAGKRMNRGISISM